MEDILNVIVKQAEYYKWEVNDGVVNIYPKNGRADRFEQLLAWGNKAQAPLVDMGAPLGKSMRVTPGGSSPSTNV